MRTNAVPSLPLHLSPLPTALSIPRVLSRMGDTALVAVPLENAKGEDVVIAAVAVAYIPDVDAFLEASEDDFDSAPVETRYVDGKCYGAQIVALRDAAGRDVTHWEAAKAMDWDCDGIHAWATTDALYLLGLAPKPAMMGAEM